MVVAHYKRGSTNMHYKSAHSDENFKCADFLKAKFKKQVENGKVLPPMTEYKGVQAERKKGIISNLLPLMPENRKAFWLNMKTSE